MLFRPVTAIAMALSVAGNVSAAIETPCSAFWNAPTVFAGRADSIVRTAAGRRVTFSVIERFKGRAASALVLAIDSSSPCASRFKQGREYLVYAVARDEELTVECARTRDVEDAAADLSYARAVIDGSAPAGTISGQAVVTRRDLAGTIVERPRPATGVAVRVSKDGVEDRSVTNHAGDFSIVSRGPGRYSFAIDVPNGYYLETLPAAVELRDTRACAQTDVRLSYDGRLAGRMVDAAARPVAGLTVNLFTTNLAQRRVALTDRDGRYEIAGLPPGKFVVGVASAVQSRTGKPARVYFPGQVSASAATRVALGEGQRIELPDFRLPAAVKYVAVQGFVLDADGRPAENAQVYLKGASEGDRIVGEPVTVDFVGRFAVAALAGAEYVMFAERRRGSRVDSSDQTRFTPADAQKPITLVLHRRY
jgi:hypothetical protein